MKTYRKRKIFSFIITAVLGLNLAAASFLPAHAAQTDYQALAESNKLMTVESNEIPGWPQGPAVSAKSAILLEANTGTILYEKNIHEKLYPASTTKILTAYIARQHSSLDETVEYSAEAVNSINWLEDANIGIKVGESLTMEQSLYGLMVGSANECANAIGEHISGSIPAFVDLMNETAQKLGCTNSHFVTTNGIHDDEHYTTAHDLALIAQQYFSDELLCKMSKTGSYVIPQSPTLSRELIPNSKNSLLPGKPYAYEYLVGSKTGYTSIARQSLVSCAEKDGLKLICVVMQDESPMQFTDTVDLFNYGFSNFNAVNIAANDTSYNVRGSGSFMTESDIFGSGDPLLSIDPDAYLVAPADISFQDVTSSLRYDNLSQNQAALITYTYQGKILGMAPVLLSHRTEFFDFDALPSIPAQARDSGTVSDAAALQKNAAQTVKNKDVLLLDVKKAAIAAGCIAGLLLILLIFCKIVHNRRLSKRRRTIMNRRRRRNNLINLDRYTKNL